LKLEVEHGVDARTRSSDGRFPALKRRKISLLFGWRRIHRLLHGRLLCGRLLHCRLKRDRLSSRSGGSCGDRGSGGRPGSKRLEKREVASLFRARLDGGK
jgi:hypothetical protein